MFILPALTPASTSAAIRQHSSEAALLTSEMSLVHRSNMLYLQCTEEGGVYKFSEFSSESVWPWGDLSPTQKGDRRPGSGGQNQFCSGGQNLPPESGPVRPAASHPMQEDHHLVISPTQRRLFTKDNTLVKLNNGILWQAQWDFSSQRSKS